MKNPNILSIDSKIIDNTNISEDEETIILSSTIVFQNLNPKHTYAFSFQVFQNGVEKGGVIPKPFDNGDMYKHDENFVTKATMNFKVTPLKKDNFNVKVVLIKLDNVNENTNEIHGQPVDAKEIVVNQGDAHE